MNAAAGALLTEARRTPGRVLLTGLAICVATAFAAVTLLFAGTLRQALTEGAVTTPVAATAVVRSPAEGTLAAVRAVPGVTDATEFRSAYLAVRGGVDGTWRAESDPMTGPLSRIGAVRAGHLPSADGEVLVGADTAERLGLVPGATLTLPDAEGRPRTLTVTGTVDLPGAGADRLVGSVGTLATLGASVEQIDVTGSADLAALRAAAGDAEVRTGAEQRQRELDDLSRSVTAVLAGIAVFVVLALIAAVVVVASTFRIVLSRRRTQLALLRCVGASRRQVGAAVLAEAAFTGLLAGSVGVAGALGLGYALIALLRGAGLDVPALVVPWAGLAGCVLLAVAATLLAAGAPALAATRIPPVAALGAADAGESGVPRARPRLLLGGTLAVLAVLVGVLARGREELAAVALTAVSGLLVFATLVVLGPLLVGVLGRALGAARLGAAGRLAVANARQVPRRTAATITVLTLGVGLASALLVALAGLNAESERAVARMFPAAAVVVFPDAAGDTGVVSTGPRTPDALVAALAGDPAVRARMSTEEPAAVLVDPAPGRDPGVVRAALVAALGANPLARVGYLDVARAETAEQLTEMRGIGLGLVGMTLLVAVVGVGVTLTLSVTERTRETGLLRALGLTRPQVRRTVAAEAGLAGAAAALLGVVLGGLYGVLAVRSLGFSEAFGLPWAELAALTVGVLGVAVLAATAPAVRAARVPPTAALQ